MSDITTNTSTTNIQILQYYLYVRYDFLLNHNSHRLEIRDKSDEEVRIKYLKDFDFNTILRYVKLVGIPCSKKTLKMLMFSIYFNQIDPDLDYMDILRELDDVNYIQDFGDITREFWTFSLRKWIDAMVASHVYYNIDNQLAIKLS